MFACLVVTIRTQVARPDGASDSLGLSTLDEPAANQSDANGSFRVLFPSHLHHQSVGASTEVHDEETITSPCYSPEHRGNTNCTCTHVRQSSHRGLSPIPKRSTSGFSR